MLSHFDINITPKKIPELETYAEELYLMIENYSSSLINAITTFTRGVMAWVYLSQQAEMDLATIQTAQRERAARGKSSRRSI